MKLTAVELRLVGPAVGAWLACWWGVATGFSWTVLVGLGCVLAAVACCALVSRSGPRWWCAAVLIGVALGAASCAWHLDSRDSSAVRQLAVSGTERVYQVEFVPTGDARPMNQPDPADIVPAPEGERFVIPARAVAVGVAGGVPQAAHGRVLVFCSGERCGGVVVGQRQRVTAMVVLPSESNLLAALLLARDEPVAVRRAPWYQDLAARLRTGLREASHVVDQPAGGLLPALSIGDTSTLDPTVKEEFQQAGLTHLTAVSGANIAIALAVVLVAARWCRAPIWLVVLLAGLALVGFVILARPSASVVRAAAMAAIGLAALLIGRRRLGVPALAAAVLGLLLIDPALARDYGFGLSVAATAGLVIVAPGWRDWLKQHRVPGGVSEALAATAAAQLACTPLLVALGDGLNLVAVPANLLAELAVAPVTIAGLLGAGIAPWWMDAAKVVVWLGGWPARWLVAVAGFAAQIRVGRVSFPAGVVGAVLVLMIIVAVVFLWRARRARIVLSICLLLAVVVWTPSLFGAFRSSGWRLVMCDVGQGDALALTLTGGAAVVIDTGPDPVAASRCLREHHISSIPLLIISHLHADHVGGLAGVARGRHIGGIVMPAGQPSAAVARLRKWGQRARIPVAVVGAGWRAEVGPAQLRVLGSQPNQHSFAGTRSDPNNNSLVLRLQIDHVVMLLTGDIEIEAQQALVRDNESLRATVLKVPHHGSAYTDPEFLAAVAPRIALISVGQGNRYGHPSRSTIGRLRQLGTRVLRTDRDGECQVLLEHGHVVVSTRGRGP